MKIKTMPEDSGYQNRFLNRFKIKKLAVIKYRQPIGKVFIIL
jgi:hypothetical protein